MMRGKHSLHRRGPGRGKGPGSRLSVIVCVLVLVLASCPVPVPDRARAGPVCGLVRVSVADKGMGWAGNVGKR